MSLTKEQRAALPATDFAVPAQRALPIHDERHVRMAWQQVGKAGGLSDIDRIEARSRIKTRAQELGLDTTTWDQIKSLRLEAMALDLPEITDHPNRMPFSGVLVKLDQASCSAPHGSKGKKVVMSAAAAEEALPSLLGMAVDITADFDGHDAQQKIGVITGATIEGEDLKIDGFIYAADFPEEAAFIKANKDDLGFSFEAQQIFVQSLDVAPLVITACVFTGAAILLKDKAAFTTTSLAASAAGDIEMTKEELLEAVGGLLKPITDEITAIKAGQTALDEKLAASAKPSNEEVASATDILKRAGISLAAAGTSIDATAITSAVEAATKPLTEKISTLETKLADGIAAARGSVAPPERKTIPPQITAILAKAGVDAPEDGKKLPAGELDRILASSPVSERMRLKTAFAHAGLID